VAGLPYLGDPLLLALQERLSLRRLSEEVKQQEASFLPTLLHHWHRSSAVLGLDSADIDEKELCGFVSQKPSQIDALLAVAGIGREAWDCHRG
jgi:hypothetical protein